MSSEVTTRVVEVDGDDVEWVEQPETVGELREVLQRVNRDRLHAVVWGGRTRLTFGNAGGPFGLAISTARLTRVIQYEPDDMTLAVEPGCTIGQLHALLAAGGQQIALDVAHPGRATIGGSYATGMSGPRRLG